MKQDPQTHNWQLWRYPLLVMASTQHTPSVASSRAPASSEGPSVSELSSKVLHLWSTSENSVTIYVFKRTQGCRIYYNKDYQLVKYIYTQTYAYIHIHIYNVLIYTHILYMHISKKWLNALRMLTRRIILSQRERNNFKLKCMLVFLWRIMTYIKIIRHMLFDSTRNFPLKYNWTCITWNHVIQGCLL